MVEGYINALLDNNPNTFILTLQHEQASQLIDSMVGRSADFSNHTDRLIPLLIEALTNEHNGLIQAPAAQLLGIVGPYTAKYLPDILLLLSDERAWVRAAAIAAIRAIGTPALNLLPEMRKLAQSDKEDIRADALQVVGSMELLTSKGDLSIINHLKDPSSWVRNSVIGFVSRRPESVKEDIFNIIRLLKHADASIRADAAKALGAMGPLAHIATLEVMTLLSTSKKDFTRVAAIDALGSISRSDEEVRSTVASYLDSSNGFIRAAALRSLSKFRIEEDRTFELIGEKLDDPDPFVRREAVATLAAIGKAPTNAPLKIARMITVRDITQVRLIQEVLPKLVDSANEQGVVGEFLLSVLVSGKDALQRADAAYTLGRLGRHARKQIPKLAKLVRSRGGSSFEEAVRVALGNMSPHDVAAIVEIARENVFMHSEVRLLALNTLVELGHNANGQEPLFVSLIDDAIPWIRASALVGIARVMSSEQRAIELVASRVADPNELVRMFVAQALGVIDHQSKIKTETLTALLQDKDSEVRIAAATSLATTLPAHRGALPALASLLGDRVYEVRVAARYALLRAGPIKVEEVAQILTHCSALAPLIGEMRLFGHVIGGAQPSMEALLTLLCRSNGASTNIPEWDVETTSRILAALEAVWLTSSDFGELRQDIAFETARLASRLASDVAPNEELTKFIDYFRSGGFPTEADHIQGVLSKRREEETEPKHATISKTKVPAAERPPEPVSQTKSPEAGRSVETDTNKQPSEAKATEESVREVKAVGLLNVVWAWVWKIGVMHAVFWLFLIFAYPKSRVVQAVFFWNRWVRVICGAGYVGLLLMWVPSLRRRLFAPFTDALLADAQIADFDDESYFRGCLVSRKDGRLQAVVEAIPRVRGQVVLEGESGFGKSMFLRNLVKNYDGLVVFLPAKNCEAGVLEAIQKKLHGHAGDRKYLSSLLHLGALDIVIDGLDEVSPNTRAVIVEFAKQRPGGNILLSTQPMVWNPPPKAKILTMMPLEGMEIERFLGGRIHGLQDRDNKNAQQLANQVTKLIYEMYDHTRPRMQREAMRRVLSNPMDLSIVAELLLTGKSVNVFNLQRQYYDMMEEEYVALGRGRTEFPLKQFSEFVYDMKMADLSILPGDRFEEEQLVMARHKMLTAATSVSAGKGNWRFRHERVCDFFVVQTFLRANNSRPKQHLGDMRFRGVYLQLANLLPLDAARDLEQAVMHHAAETRDHTVSDEFVKLVQYRKEVQEDLT